MAKFKNYALLIMAGIVIVLGFMLDSFISENKRLESNQRSLMEGIETYQTKDSTNAASVEALKLTNSELKRYNESLVQTVKSLNLKVKNLQSVSQTATETGYNVKIQVKDSLIYLPGKVDTLKCVDFDTKWLTVQGCVQNRQFSGRIESRDSIVTVVHRVPRRFLFFRYGTKAVRQDVTCKNPDSKITFTEYLEFK